MILTVHVFFIHSYFFDITSGGFFKFGGIPLIMNAES